MKRSTRHSRYGIVPPYILSSIANHGTAEQRVRALKTLQHQQQQHIHPAHDTYEQAETHAKANKSDKEDHAILARQAKRTIYDVQHTSRLPGKIVRKEGQGSNSDIAVNEAYSGLGWAFNLYRQKFNRNSIDNKGLALKASIHYNQDYDNAFWDDVDKRVVFGDGDGDYFNRFTIALEVIGHEMTHGVTASETNLDYQGQPGALNESISDVFGSLVKQFSLNQSSEEADWLIGNGLFTSKVQGQALRSMKAPGTAYDDPVLGKDPQPASMDGYVDTTDDNGGVHINSGIPNHAFYLVASTLGGYAWEKAGLIWYKTLTDPDLETSANFSDFAQLTIKQAEALYGARSLEKRAVQQAWETVKVLGATTTHSHEEEAAD